jgi:hypothetical protein
MSLRSAEVDATLKLAKPLVVAVHRFMRRGEFSVHYVYSPPRLPVMHTHRESSNSSTTTLTYGFDIFCRIGEQAGDSKFQLMEEVRYITLRNA